MDLSTMIVDLLRGDENKKLDPKSVAAYTPAPSPLQGKGTHPLTNPAYAAYKREALANGEPVMSPEQFAAAQSGAN
jgi:hypothetical protein